MLKTTIRLTIFPLLSVGLLMLGYHLSGREATFDLIFILVLIGLFFTVMLIASVRVIVFHYRRKTALETQSVAAHIEVVSTPSRRGNDSLVAEIKLGDVRWRASLTAYAHDRTMSGKSGAGRAWLYPNNGAPLAIEFGGKQLSIVPEIVRVKPNSFLEKLIQKSRRL